jgi:branched-subunit amino acid aminotransferase/4-amino-4-deoxychorismate lyase
MFVWLNGRVVPARAARVSALDRGLLHGDGLYDTWRTYGGEPFATAAHLRRLAAAAKRLGFPSPGDPHVWHVRARRLVARNELADAAIRLTMTRGATGEGLHPTRSGRPTLLLTVRPIPTAVARQQADGIACVLLPFPRDAAFPWGTMKLIGHMSALVGRRLAVRQRADEGLYVTRDGEVTEGTTSNLFVVEGNRLVTPPLQSGVLGGVTRDLVLRLAPRLGLAVREEPIRTARLRRAAEVFVTASTIEVLPVVRLEGRRVGSGAPGAATRRLHHAYRAHVQRACTRTRH